MRRITNNDLEMLVKMINEATDSPLTPFGTDWNIGNYHISGAYGGVSLHRICSDGGGIRDVFGSGHMPKRELYNRMHAFLAGVDYKQKDIVSTVTITPSK